MIRVLTTAYNCQDYIERCINSIKSQVNAEFRCYILDDMSTDGTPQRAIKAIGNDNRFILVTNMDRKHYQPGNYDSVIRHPFHRLNDDDICVEVDGDDFLPDPNVFERVLDYYADGKTWITYGQFRFENGPIGFSREVDIPNIRRSEFTASHLRTWVCWLWKKIKVEDLYNGTWYAETAGDTYFMFPMLEMAGKEHSKFVTDVNYVYNHYNPINDHKVDLGKQRGLAWAACQKTPYLPL